MPSLEQFRRRRDQLFDSLDRPLLLMAGGERSRNYPDNPYPYRPDSNWLLFFAEAEAGSAAFFDPADRRVVLFLDERTPQNALWHGAEPPFEEMRDRLGVSAVEPRAELAKRVQDLAKGRPIDTFAVADSRATAEARAITGCADLDFYDAAHIATRPEIVQAIGALRVAKDQPEIEEMRRTAAITREAHVAAIAHTRPGMLEQELAGIVDGCFLRHGCVPAYSTILSVRGEVLHNHDHSNELREGDIVLLDAGAESPTGYCSDVTRSWPVSGRFEGEARAVYETVLRAELASIEQAVAGARYRDLHLTSARVVAEGLADLGVLRGKPEDLVECGAHALFFPHGVGHLIGLDVHDMEAYGDAIAYPDKRERSEQFGLGYLRLDINLRPGMTFTIEPGIYFVPAILHNDDFRRQFQEHVDFERAEQFLAMNDGRGFGGIRIEDDVLCTTGQPEVLTNAIPKALDEIEAIVGSAL